MAVAMMNAQSFTFFFTLFLASELAIMKRRRSMTASYRVCNPYWITLAVRIRSSAAAPFE